MVVLPELKLKENYKVYCYSSVKNTIICIKEHDPTDSLTQNTVKQVV